MSKEEMQNLLSNHIIFTDKTLSYTKINDLFNAADLYLSPYLAEGFNLTCLESLSAGLPVMAPKTGSTKEYMNDIYNNGGQKYINYIESRVIDVGNNMKQNEITMESLLQAILGNEESIKQMQVSRNSDNLPEYENMKNYIRNNYSWSKVSELLYDYFKYIVN